ncbi:TPA: hypothetical protein ACWLUJ_006155 [Pseudomonas aeruginosa]|nr:hypothetical protein [Pseudomonas aeruginosa]
MKKLKWIICPCCQGNAKVDNPAFSNGFTSRELLEMDESEHVARLDGSYDVPCKDCKALGRVQVPDVAAMTFGEKRVLAKERREAREEAKFRSEMAAERAAERAFGC